MKKSIVLFTTLLMIMALMSVMMIFLNSTKETQNNITREYALIQTNSIMSNLSQYFNNIKFDEDTIFYGSKMPFSLPLGNSDIKFTIDSNQKYLNINQLIISMKNKDNIEYTNFISYLYRYKLRDPDFFIDILLDTIDNDTFEKNSGSGSEIVLENPIFRNGKIYNQKHFQIILDYYFSKTEDKAIYDIPFENLISFNSSLLDINFANKDIINIFFYDADQFSLNMVSKHGKIYEKFKDLPFDKSYLKELKKARYGHNITFKTIVIKVVVDLKYKEQFISKISFLYNTKSKSLGDYKVLDIKILK